MAVSGCALVRGDATGDRALRLLPNIRLKLPGLSLPRESE
jgi:hypothetical protein